MRAQFGRTANAAYFGDVPMSACGTHSPSTELAGGPFELVIGMAEFAGGLAGRVGAEGGEGISRNVDVVLAHGLLVEMDMESIVWGC